MSDKSEETADSEATRYHSLASESAATTSNTEYFTVPTTDDPTEFATCPSTATEKEKKKVKKDSVKKDSVKTAEELKAELSDYDEKDDPFLGPSPANHKFSGKLTDEEKWHRCPYYSGHVYRTSQTLTHLFACRRKYMEEKGMKEDTADIVVCQFDAMHHGPKAKLEKHQMYCEKGSLFFLYLDANIENQRWSNYVKRKTEEMRLEAEKAKEAEMGKAGPGPGPGPKKEEEEDVKKMMDGGAGTDGKVDEKEVKGDIDHGDVVDKKKVEGGMKKDEGDKTVESSIDDDFDDKKKEGGVDSDADYHGDTEGIQDESSDDDYEIDENLDFY